MSDSNANSLLIRWNMHLFSSFFSHFFASSDDFLILPSTFACWKTYFQKSSRNCSKIGTRNSTRNWKIVTRIDSIENFHNWFWARLDSIPKSINSTRVDLINFQLVPPLVSTSMNIRWRAGGFHFLGDYHCFLEVSGVQKSLWFISSFSTECTNPI